MQFDQQKPNGLTLTAQPSKSPWGYMHSHFQSPWAWSCCAISTNCSRAKDSYKNVLYTTTFKTSPLATQSCTGSSSISFCTSSVEILWVLKRSSITSSAWGWWLWPVWVWMAYVQLHRPNWKFQWNMHLQPVQKYNGKQLSLIPTTPRLTP